MKNNDFSNRCNIPTINNDFSPASYDKNINEYITANMDGEGVSQEQPDGLMSAPTAPKFKKRSFNNNTSTWQR